MEESIKIQEEFENLIEQLERLKKINELTSANTRSARAVIESVELFNQNATTYINKLNNELSEKSVILEQLIIESKKVLSLLDKKSNENYLKFVNFFKELNLSEALGNINEFVIANNEILDSVQHKLIVINDDLSKSHIEILENISLSIDNNAEALEAFGRSLNQLMERQNQNQLFIKEITIKSNKDIQQIKMISLMFLGILILGGLFVLIYKL